MTITSFAFAVFAAVTILIYYIFPVKKYQWTVLLCGSCFFYLFNSFRYSFYIAATTISIYAAALWIEKRGAVTSEGVRKMKAAGAGRSELKSYRALRERGQRRIVAFALLLNFGILFMLKYYNFCIGSLYHVLGFTVKETPFIKLFLPLGVSFYTFQATGYLIDVYRETVRAERNICRFALFVSFFPQIIQGPISEFEQLQEQLTSEHRAEWIRFKMGGELILWGLFKKLIIADRCAPFIRTVCGSYDRYDGLVILFAAVLYALQLYADFSGGIDIARGIAKILGIDMVQNFRRPYFSRSLSEYWRRWHITLGAWMKKYVFYSLSMSRAFMNMANRIRKGGSGNSRLRIHFAKVLPPSLATFIVFLFVGIWHGANTRYLAFGIWNGLIIMVSMLCKPVFESWNMALHIRSESFVWRLVQMTRTFVLVLVGYYFDIADDFVAACEMMKRSLTDVNLGVAVNQLHGLPLRRSEYMLLIAAVLILFVSSVLMEVKRLDEPGELLLRRNAALQWVTVFVILMLVLICGVYGPAYDAADFIYMGF